MTLSAAQESAYSAHRATNGVFGGVVGAGHVTGGVEIDNSYGEWLDSPYSDPKTGQTCQDCHMPNGGLRLHRLPGNAAA